MTDTQVPGPRTERPASRWPAVVAFGLLMAGVGIAAWSALFACGISGPFGGLDNCPARVVQQPAQPPPQAAAEDAETERLRRELADIRRRLQQAAACPVPPERRAEAAPACVPRTVRLEQQLVVILDATPSMRIPLELTPEELGHVKHIEAEVIGKRDAAGQRQQANPASSDVFAKLIKGDHGRLTRLQAAKRDLVGVVQGLGTRPVRFVSMLGCSKFNSQYDVPASQIGGAVGPIEPDGAGGTDIAGALKAAADSMRPNAQGRYDGIIMLVTDGAQSCDGDPCAAAREIHRTRPGISINVVDVAGHSDVRCVTGSNGRLWRVGQGAELSGLLREAQTMTDPSSCPPASREVTAPAK